MAIVFRHVGFEWPNGQIVFDDLSFSLNGKKHALIGANGAGKTTLARLILGELQPTSGTVSKSAREKVGFFRQMENPPAITVAEYLEDGTSYSHVLLGEIALDRPCSSLSGGEWTRVRLVKAASESFDFLILDEPTNHLDQAGRQVVHDFLWQFSAGVLLISHDRELLQKADEVLELSEHGLSAFGGSWEEYSDFRLAEQERLSRELEQAKKKRESTQQKRHEQIERQEKRRRKGKQQGAKSNLPKIIRGGLQRAAEETQGKIDRATMQDVNDAVTHAWEAYQSLKVDPVMYAKLPPVDLPRGKTLMEAEDFNFRFSKSAENLWQENLNFSFKGPARVAVRGPNGSGKSTLLHLLQGKSPHGTKTGNLRLGSVQAEFLDQSYSRMDQALSVFENVRASANLAQSELWNLLAMFLFKGDFVHQKFSDLSGGERLRAALAKCLLSDPPANVLFLDEPTNNLDLPNIEFLEDLLRQYQGGLVIVSHDQRFLERLDVTDEIILKSRAKS